MTAAVLGPYGRVVVPGDDPGVWEENTHRRVMERAIEALEADLAGWIAYRVDVEAASDSTGKGRKKLKEKRRAGCREREAVIARFRAHLAAHVAAMPTPTPQTRERAA